MNHGNIQIPDLINRENPMSLGDLTLSKSSCLSPNLVSSPREHRYNIIIQNEDTGIFDKQFHNKFQKKCFMMKD